METSSEHRLTIEAKIGGDLDSLVKLFRIYQRTNRQLHLNNGSLFAKITNAEKRCVAIDVISFFDVQYRITGGLLPPHQQPDPHPLITKSIFLCDEDCLGWRLHELPEVLKEFLEKNDVAWS